MKRFVLLLLVITFLTFPIFSVAVQAADGLIFTVENVTTKSGDSVLLPIRVSGNPGFSSVRLNITLDSRLEWDYDPLNYTNNQSTWPFIGSSEVLPITTARPTGANFTDSYVNLMFPSNMENTYENGLLVTLKLKVSATSDSGNIPITVVVSQCFDENDIDVPFDIISGAITVIAPPVITTASLLDGTVASVYDQTLTATGGNITWSVTEGSLPDGLELDPVRGVITGVPTAPGTSNFTVKAENSVGSATQQLSIVISAGAIVLGGEVNITGSAIYNEILTAVTTGLTTYPAGADRGDLHYQWKRTDADIVGANSATYLLIQNDIGQMISVTVTASNCMGEVTSTPVGPVAKAQQAPLVITPVTNKTYGDPPFQLSTSGGSGAGTVTYKLISGPAIVTENGQVTITGAGEVVVTATKASDDNYEVSTSAPLTIYIAKATYSVTVINGTGDGDYEEGATVNISAGTPPEGLQFANWTTESSGVTFENANNADTSFIMPANPVTVTANFVLNIYPVAFLSLTANGTANSDTTTALTLTFDQAIPGLSADNITVTGATKGTLSGAGPVYTLGISGTWAEGTSVTVAVASPDGYLITPTTLSTTVHKADNTGGYKIYDSNFRPAPINMALNGGSAAQFYATLDGEIITSGIKWLVVDTRLATVSAYGLVNVNKNKYTGQLVLMLYSSENKLLDSIILRII
ncbi:MAG: putative Ig domain-containing protein [Oscillospiraceae bacterium]|nr:putative Ig domain-containing protein [Oscillospiraceae bacterium]